MLSDHLTQTIVPHRRGDKETRDYQWREMARAPITLFSPTPPPPTQSEHPPSCSLLYCHKCIINFLTSDSPPPLKLSTPSNSSAPPLQNLNAFPPTPHPPPHLSTASIPPVSSTRDAEKLAAAAVRDPVPPSRFPFAYAFASLALSWFLSSTSS